MNCEGARGSFSGYLDGAVSGRTMGEVASHLEHCAGCSADFAAWRAMQRALAAAGPRKAPADLGLKLRLAISHEQARREKKWFDGFAVRWENFLRPALLQFSAGLAGAVVLVGTIGMLVGVVAAPQAVLAHDEPLGAMTSPHYLYSAIGVQPVTTQADATIVIEADVNARGEVYRYAILSGPSDPATESQVRDRLMLQVYEPARLFGQPVRGQVLVTFSGVSVRG